MKKILLSIFTLFACTSLFAQVGIGTINPSTAAMLEVSSSSNNTDFGGFMPPRVDNLTERDLINPQGGDFGLMVFVVDTGGGIGCLQLWTGVVWENVHCTTNPVVVPPNLIPWINEIHYDNTGDPDTDEGVEIAGLAGVDLSDYEIIRYNGAVGTQYGTATALSGYIDDEGTGYGAVWVPISPIQNGGSAADGIVLHQISTGTVIQFLSYEGSFTAYGGPADLMISTDIGVEETGSEEIGNSLQLSGSGDEYHHFTWLAPSTASPGDINTLQNIN